MAYTNDPANSDTDKVRLIIGDIDPNTPIFGDDEYNYWISKNSNNINRAAIEAARAMLFFLPRFIRERAGDIEVYGGEWARNYRLALKDFLDNPSFSLYIAMPYAGGISKADMERNNDNPDNVRPSITCRPRIEASVFSWRDCC